MTIGERVRAYRTENDLNQTQLAKRVMVTQQMINRVENDLSKPGIDLAIRLSDVFGCTLDELCRTEADKNP